MLAIARDFFLRNSADRAGSVWIVGFWLKDPLRNSDLAHEIPALIVYGTALATEAGEVLFFDDLYGQDRRLEQLLGLAPVR